ncbi:MAG: wax ester/triacylglycerol synthase domain-containing protein, partial [Ilumatobacteraceae bacterium]
MTDELAADDAAILALENDSITGHTLKLVLLEPSAAPLDVDALRASISSRLGTQARARQLVATGADGKLCWVVDQEFDVAAHVGRDETADVDGDPTTALR